MVWHACKNTTPIYGPIRNRCGLWLSFGTLIISTSVIRKPLEIETHVNIWNNVKTTRYFRISCNLCLSRRQFSISLTAAKRVFLMIWCFRMQRTGLAHSVRFLSCTVSINSISGRFLHVYTSNRYHVRSSIVNVNRKYISILKTIFVFQFNY